MPGNIVGHAVGVLQFGPGHIVQASERVAIRHVSRYRHTRPVYTTASVTAGKTL